MTSEIVEVEEGTEKRIRSIMSQESLEDRGRGIKENSSLWGNVRFPIGCLRCAKPELLARVYASSRSSASRMDKTQRKIVLGLLSVRDDEYKIRFEEYLERIDHSAFNSYQILKSRKDFDTE